MKCFMYLASLLLIHPKIVIGKMTKSIAFSWTCQPNRKEVQPQRQRHLINCWILFGLNQSLTRAGNHTTEICQNRFKVLYTIMSFFHNQDFQMWYYTSSKSQRVHCEKISLTEGKLGVKSVFLRTFFRWNAITNGY